MDLIFVQYSNPSFELITEVTLDHYKFHQTCSFLMHLWIITNYFVIEFQILFSKLIFTILECLNLTFWQK